MFDEAAVERRLTALEQEVAELKRQAASKPAENWIERFSNCITDKEALMQAAAYGREFREADRPKDDEAEQS